MISHSAAAAVAFCGLNFRGRGTTMHVCLLQALILETRRSKHDYSRGPDIAVSPVRGATVVAEIHHAG